MYKKFGGDFKESVINRALAIELESKGLVVEDQKRIDIFHGGAKVGAYVPDLVVDGSILIELKVKPFLTAQDDRQFWRYLNGSDYKLGFLVNFGPRKLEIKRRVFDKARDPRKSASKE